MYAMQKKKCVSMPGAIVAAVAGVVGLSVLGAPTAAADPAAGLIGAGCADYTQQVPTGPGSIADMSTEPVTVATSNNPLLTTLNSALSGELNPDVNLVDTLNNGEYTIFAPSDAAFAKLDPATIETLKTDAPQLRKILTYHVVPGRLGPDQINGTWDTVEGQPVVVTGGGNDVKFNSAGLVCGGVDTSNATVYIIDDVLTPM